MFFYMLNSMGKSQTSVYSKGLIVECNERKFWPWSVGCIVKIWGTFPLPHVETIGTHHRRVLAASVVGEHSPGKRVIGGFIPGSIKQKTLNLKLAIALAT